MTDDDDTLARSGALIINCLQCLEQCLHYARDHGGAPEDCPEWEHVFGSKETVVSVLGKLVSMQKTVRELQAKADAELAVESSGPMSDEEWELLDLCVQRWKDRKLGENG